MKKDLGENKSGEERVQKTMVAQLCCLEPSIAQHIMVEKVAHLEAKERKGLEYQCPLLGFFEWKIIKILLSFQILK